MNELNDFSDVLADNVEIVHAKTAEFEFDGYIIRREMNHWEIQFDDSEGEQGIIVEREDFAGGKFEFDIDGQMHALDLEDFDRIERFAYENGLIA